MIAITFALISALLMAVISHRDKYILTKHLKDRGIGSIVVFSSLISIPTLIVIRLIEPNVMNISWHNSILIILNGIIYASWIIPYLYALQTAEASVVALLFQLSPVFTYILGAIFLKEYLSITQLVGCCLIFIGSFSLAIENDETQIKKYTIRKDTFLLMTLAAFLSAFSSFLFKFVAKEESFWITSFWQYVGFGLFSLIVLIFVKNFRNQFMSMIRGEKRKALGLNILVNEGLNMLAKILYDYALLLAPIAIVSFLAEGSEPIFVFLIGIILAIFLPHISKEKVDKLNLVRRLLAIGVVGTGAAIVSFL